MEEACLFKILTLSQNCLSHVESVCASKSLQLSLHGTQPHCVWQVCISLELMDVSFLQLQHPQSLTLDKHNSLSPPLSQSELLESKCHRIINLCFSIHLQQVDSIIALYLLPLVCIFSMYIFHIHSCFLILQLHLRLISGHTCNISLL